MTETKIKPSTRARLGRHVRLTDSFDSVRQKILDDYESDKTVPNESKSF